MDQLLEILINAIIALFRGGGGSSQQTVQRPVARPPVRPVGARPPVKVTPVGQRTTTTLKGGYKVIPPTPPKRGAAAPVAAKAVPPVLPPPTAASFAVSAPIVPATRGVTARVGAVALRKWLTPEVMRNQFILTEILQPPLTLRRNERI